MADESRDDVDVFSGDSDGYQSDSDADSDGYQSDSEIASDRYLSEDLGPLIDVWKSMREGWWNKAGYETYWDYVQVSEKRWAQMGFQSIYKKRKRRPKSGDLPDASPPDLDLAALAEDATRPRNSRDRQVNVRLTELGYEALAQAARAYGLRPSTLARLLIHRGALAVLEAQKAESETRSG
jgi:hypothetical protein